MYFPHAFRKSFIPETGGTLELAGGGTTADLSAGQLGVFNSKTFSALTVAGTTPFIIAQGSYFTKDKISPALGGYQESLKSKVVNPKYISRVIHVGAKEPSNQVISIGVDGCALNCDDTYRLRIDLKGSPALRFLSHNLYYTVDGYTGCCDADLNPVDPVVVLLQWADRLKVWPLTTPFVDATVYVVSETGVSADVSEGAQTIVVANGDASLFELGDKVTGDGIAGNSKVVYIGSANSGGSGFTEVNLSKNATADVNGSSLNIWKAKTTANYTPSGSPASVVASLDIAVAYEETKFGTCTFTPTDFYELQPLQIYASFRDDSGDPCNVNCFAISEIQAPAQASGLGESVVRDLILSGRYQQNAYPDSSRIESFRMREIETDPKIIEMSSVGNRNSFFDQVMILHSVPRFNNPTGTFDNDQYLLVFHVPAGTNTALFTDFVINSAVAAGNAISLEQY